MKGPILVPAMAHREQSRRHWVSGLALAATVLACLFALARVAPEATYIMAAVALIVLVVVFWRAGKAKEG